MTIENNQSMTLFRTDAFKYVWKTSKSNVIAKFFKAVISFFCGRKVTVAQWHDYLNRSSSSPVNTAHTAMDNNKELSSRVVKPLPDQPPIMPTTPLSSTAVNTDPNNNIIDKPTVKPKPSKLIGFKNYGNTCFINTGLKCIFEALGPRFIEEIDEEHAKKTSLLQSKIDNGESTTYNKNELAKLESIEEQIGAFIALARNYFAKKSETDIDKSLQKFLLSLRKHVDHDPENSVFRNFFDTRVPSKELGARQNSSIDFILTLLSAFTSEPLRFGLKTKTLIKYESELKLDQQPELSLVPLQNNHRTVYNQILRPENGLVMTSAVAMMSGDSMTESVARTLAPDSVEVTGQSIQLEICKGQNLPENTQLSIPNGLQFYTTSEKKYSANLDKLKCIILEPILQDLQNTQNLQNIPGLQEAKETMNQNIVVPITHENTSKDSYFHHGQDYDVEFQPVCVGIHHGRSNNAGHKVALIRDKNGSFYEHNDFYVGDPKDSISEFSGLPEGIIYKLVSVTPKNK